MKKIKNFLHKYKYEILLFGLFQHLFIGIFLTHETYYTPYIWNINMIIIGITSIGVFIEKGKIIKIIKNILTFIVVFLPFFIHFFNVKMVMQYSSVLYFLFFIVIFYEVIKFLIKPSYINLDIIIASACGYLLMIEISSFLFQFLYHSSSNIFSGISSDLPFSVFMDLIYFSTTTITSVGIGDIAPKTYYLKLIVALLSIIGQFYTVVLLGILIGKYTSRKN